MSKATPADGSRFGSRLTRVAWIGLGGNRRDSLALLLRALQRLRHHRGVDRLTLSPLYLTQPVGPVQAQSWFVNGVAVVETRLGASALLSLLSRIETAAGRNRKHEIHWGPRPLDLDLLFHGQRVMRTRTLVLPHPRLHRRRFVLQPMADLAPGWIHPRFGKTIDTLLREVDDTARIIPWSEWARTPVMDGSSRAATLPVIPRMCVMRGFSSAPFQPKPSGTPGSPFVGDRDGLS
ncbi:MAG: 2-amino-4-hydroxy-6-hydroxymethyldihydropteridine diphosphokinase [Magnetococcales bacterium]|nr:2-amino-4-hydroxy-6-hydroxymethyldihydropteridine diphosphokinase [Magnetococcales bacterium]